MGLSPGLLLVQKSGQYLNETGVHETCTGGIVTTAAIRTGGSSAGTLHTVPVSCNSLRANETNTSIPWAGQIQVTWETGQGFTVANISAHVVASSGHSTTFAFRGTTNQNPNSPFGAGKGINGRFTINKGLNTPANGGDCQTVVKLPGGSVSASTLNIK